MTRLSRLLAMLMLACTLDAQAETRILTISAVIEKVESLNGYLSPAAPFPFVAGTPYTSTWIITDQGLQSTRTEIMNVTLNTEGGDWESAYGFLNMESGPFYGDQRGPASWNLPVWLPVYTQILIRDEAFTAGPPGVFPSLAQLLSTPAEDRQHSILFYVPVGLGPMYAARSQITSISLVPEPNAWLLFLSGSVLLGVPGRIRMSGSRSGGSR